MEVKLRRIEYPSYSTPAVLPPPSAEELQGRIDACRRMMEERGFSHMVIYSDREHFANLMYLTNFDPRFEEALMILKHDTDPLILVGNECEGHLGVSSLFLAGRLRHERFQTLSLMSQPRERSRKLETIFAEEGIGKESKVGVAGWKYFNDNELDNAVHATDMPSYIIDILRSLTPSESIFNATDMLISPVYGLRTTLSPYEIAYFEFSNVLGSESMKSMLENFRAGVTDYEAMKNAGYNGFPLACHMSIKSHDNQHYGLTSPVGGIVTKGEPCSVSMAYWGSNICRAGWVAENEDDLPETAKGYIEKFAGPYFLAVREWLRELRIGAKGGDLYRLIADRLPFEDFGVYLNPGHLIHFDEWTSSPIYEGSEDLIRSGMYMQIDIIPRSKKFSSSRMEEGIVIADAGLRARLEKEYPEVYARCIERRAFMESLGFELPEEILPLSNMAGIVVPYFLDCHNVLCAEK